MPGTPASLRLELLGSPHLYWAGPGERRDVHSVLRQPKRFGFFVYLTLARPREFHPRASLLPLFWPDSSEEHARTALRQTLSYLRSSMQNDVFEDRGRGELRVNPFRVSCDVLDFREFLATGASDRALALYRGPLLDGFHIDGSVDFQEWLELERERLQRLAGEGAWDVARRLEDEGRREEALRWGRRSVDLVPYHEGTVRRFIALLDRMGERGNAIREYRRLEERLERDLDVEPSPETRDLVRRVRARAEALWRFPLAPHVERPADG